MNEEELRVWLDTQNRQLLAEIEQNIPVRFTLWDKTFHACQVHKDDQGNHNVAEIFYREETSHAKIAHELLHAKTAIILGDGIALFDVPNKTSAYEGLLQGENAGGIVNACDHVIFFPEYIDMGYREEDSFEEYNPTDEALQLLDFLCNHRLRLGGRYDTNRVFQYISLAFSFYFYPNENRFMNEVNALRIIDRGLFRKLTILRNACTDLDIIPENKEYLDDAYREFGIEINRWFRVNRLGVV